MSKYELLLRDFQDFWVYKLMPKGVRLHTIYATILKKAFVAVYELGQEDALMGKNRPTKAIAAGFRTIENSFEKGN